MYSKLENKFHCCFTFLLLSQLQETEVVRVFQHQTSEKRNGGKTPHTLNFHSRRKVLNFALWPLYTSYKILVTYWM